MGESSGGVASARDLDEEGEETGSSGAMGTTRAVAAVADGGDGGARGVCERSLLDGDEVLEVDGVDVLLVTLPSLLTTCEGRSATENSEDSLNFNDLLVAPSAGGP